MSMDWTPYCFVYGSKAAYLVGIIRGWRGELPGWMFDVYRREAVANARMAAHYALARPGPEVATAWDKLNAALAGGKASE